MMERRTVAIWGGTGATGNALIQAALLDRSIARVRAFTRRPLATSDPTVEEVFISDFRDETEIERALQGVDAAFWCLGVSQSAVPDEARYREITLEYTLVAARALLRSSPEAEFHFLSGTGASADSRMMWARVKAETEAALGTVGFRRLVIWRPAYIHVSDGRLSPSASERFWSLLYPLLRLVPNATNSTHKIASAMLESIGRDAKFEVLSARDIERLAVVG